MNYIDETNAKQHIYPTYGRQFASYRWYKPIITGILFFAFFMILYLLWVEAVSIVGRSAAGGEGISMDSLLTDGYDGMNMADPIQSAVNLGGLAIAIPALWLASIIVRDRPFSSYQSSRGGWNRKVFWRCMPAALLVNSLPIIILDVFIYQGWRNFAVQFTAVSFIVLTVLGPLQCIAEEYIFRGLIMQTLGSWLRIPVLAVIVQSVAFAAGHPYNRIGQISIFCTGLAFALCAWIGRGIEVSAALHITNNMTIFYLQGLGMCKITSEIGSADLIMDLCMNAAYLIAIFVLSRKTNWFSEIRKDDVAIVNAKVAEKQARKAAKKAARLAKKTENQEYGGKHFTD